MKVVKEMKWAKHQRKISADKEVNPLENWLGIHLFAWNKNRPWIRMAMMKNHNLKVLFEMIKVLFYFLAVSPQKENLEK